MTELAINFPTDSYISLQSVTENIFTQLSRIDKNYGSNVSSTFEFPKETFGTSCADFSYHIIVLSFAPKKSLSREALIERFKTLADQWEQETLFISSADDMIANQSYQDIIKLGPDIIPILIDDMIKTQRPWFHVLCALTKENPVNEEHRGILNEIINDWIKWYHAKKTETNFIEL